MSEYPFSVTVRNYESFADISKDESANIAETTIKFSQNKPARWGYFTKLFCHRQQVDGAGAPINLNLSDLKAALDNVDISEDGSLNMNKLFKKHWFDGNDNAKRYGSSCRSVLREYMPLLLMPENPNKFLKMALDCRKKGSFGNLDNDKSDFKDPLNDFCIGLDRIAQFLNFCVMLRQIPTKKGETVKNIDQIEKLSFDKSVLKEFINQYDQEKTSLENTIGKENNIEGYKTKLKDLRAKYNNYCRAMINGENGDGSYDKCTSFTKWISQSGDFVERVIHEYDGGPLIGVYNDGPNKDKVIDGKNVDKEKVKQGYHAGGGIEDKNELTKLLKLDAVLQAGNAINQFINTKAVDESTLGWFQELWNSIVQGTWIANKLGLFFKEKNPSVKLKSNRFIPRLDECENKKTVSNEKTRSDLNDKG